MHKSFEPAASPRGPSQHGKWTSKLCCICGDPWSTGPLQARLRLHCICLCL